MVVTLTESRRESLTSWVSSASGDLKDDGQWCREEIWTILKEDVGLLKALVSKAVAVLTCVAQRSGDDDCREVLMVSNLIKSIILVVIEDPDIENDIIWGQTDNFDGHSDHRPLDGGDAPFSKVELVPFGRSNAQEESITHGEALIDAIVRLYLTEPPPNIKLMLLEIILAGWSAALRYRFEDYQDGDCRWGRALLSCAESESFAVSLIQTVHDHLSRQRTAGHSSAAGRLAAILRWRKPQNDNQNEESHELFMCAALIFLLATSLGSGCGIGLSPEADKRESRLQSNFTAPSPLSSTDFAPDILSRPPKEARPDSGMEGLVRPDVPVTEEGVMKSEGIDKSDGVRSGGLMESRSVCSVFGDTIDLKHPFWSAINSFNIQTLCDTGFVTLLIESMAGAHLHKQPAGIAYRQDEVSSVCICLAYELFYAHNALSGKLSSFAYNFNKKKLQYQKPEAAKHPDSQPPRLDAYPPEPVPDTKQVPSRPASIHLNPHDGTIGAETSRGTLKIPQMASYSSATTPSISPTYHGQTPATNHGPTPTGHGSAPTVNPWSDGAELSTNRHVQDGHGDTISLSNLITINILSFVSYAFDESNNPSHISLSCFCGLILLKLFSRRNNATSFGEPFNQNVIRRMCPEWNLPDPPETETKRLTWADWYVARIFKILSNKAVMKFPPCADALLTVLSNVAAFLRDGFSMQSAVKIVKMYETFARLSRLPSKKREDHIRHASLLASTIVNAIRHQYDGNSALMFVLLHQHKIFSVSPADSGCPPSKQDSNVSEGSPTILPKPNWGSSPTFLRQHSIDQLVHRLGPAASEQPSADQAGSDPALTKQADRAPSGQGETEPRRDEAEPRKDEANAAHETEKDPSSPDYRKHGMGIRGPAFHRGDYQEMKSSADRVEGRQRHDTCDEPTLGSLERKLEENLALIRSAIQALKPQVEELCLRAELKEPDAVIAFIAKTNLTGVLPTNKQIVVQSFANTPYTSKWVSSFFWSLLITHQLRRGSSQNILARDQIKLLEVSDDKSV